MSYQDKQVDSETLESKKAEFDAALKSYQEKATDLSLKIEALEKELEDLQESQGEAIVGLKQIQSEHADLLSKKVHLQEAIDGAAKSKVLEIEAKAKAAEAEIDAEAQTLAANQKAFAKEREDFQQGLKAISDGQAALDFRESQLVVIEKALKDREAAIVAAEEKVHQDDEDVARMRVQVDDRQKLMDEQIAGFKKQEAAFAEASEALRRDQVAWNEASVELDKKLKALADIDAERAKIDTDLKEFSLAKNRLELREAALVSLEQQLKKWEHDLNQQEAVLIAKAKGV